METETSKQAINESKSICILPAESPEAIASALALFYTLKDLDKNVNLILDEIPDELKFLSPQLDFISYPKNFVISVPNRIAEVSQIYYEKNEEAVKIFLTLEKGNVKKDDISFYYSETKPDLIITLGISDYTDLLKGKLNSYGFLIDSPILNIDSVQENKKFGKINLIENSSLAETIYKILETRITDNPRKEALQCLLCGLVIYTENFKKNITADVFELAGIIMKKGADLKQIAENLKL